MSTDGLVTAALLLGALALFMGLIWSMLAVNARAMAARGYAPFALPNVALLLIAHLLLLSALSDGLGPMLVGEPAVLSKTAVASLIIIAMGLLLVLRSGLIAGLYATLVMTALAPIVLFSLMFWQLAGTTSPGEPR